MSEKKYDPVVTVRIPIGVLTATEEWIKSNPFKVSRSAALIYLITKGLRAEGYEVTENDKNK